jgi:DNA repair ATPase RecN
MMVMRTLVGAAVMTGALLGASLSAQEFQGQPNRPGGQPLPGLENSDMTPGEIQKLFDAYLVMEAQQALELTDDQYPQFLTRLRSLQETRRRNQLERGRLMGELQRMTAPRVKMVEEAALKERLTALQEIESRTAAELRKAYASLDEVLSLKQQARFRLFEEQIERRKIELLMRARQQNRPNQQPPIRRPNQPPPGA